MLWNARNGSIGIRNTQMSYASFGYGNRYLILIPGLSDGLATVKGKALLLAKPYQLFFKQYTVYMFSRIDQMPYNYSIVDMADDLSKAMELLGIGKAAVVGVSQGGMIAQSLASRYPDKVTELILAVTSPDCNEITEECIRKWIGFAKKEDHKQLMIDTAEKSYSTLYLKRYRKYYPFLGMIGRPHDYDRFLKNAEAILNYKGMEMLDKIICPTLIIGGENDRIVGVQASYKLKGGIKNSELFIYEGLGHAAYEEAKDFNVRVFDFLEKKTKDDEVEQ